MDETRDPGDPRLRSAHALHELALEFADRAQTAEAELLADFSARAASLAPGVGPVVVSSDEDEHLVLRADGTLTGEVLDDDTGRWREIGSPADVVRYYDPTDVFLDLADAVLDAFPALADESAEEAGSDGSAAAHPAAVPPVDAVPDAEPTTAVGGRATGRMLEDLHRAGVLSDAEYDRLRAQLDA